MTYMMLRRCLGFLFGSFVAKNFGGENFRVYSKMKKGHAQMMKNCRFLRGGLDKSSEKFLCGGD